MARNTPPLNSPHIIVTIDGASGVGKGTIARLVALHFGFHLLDSGSLYRGLALAASKLGIGLERSQELSLLARNFDWQCIADTSGKAKYSLDGEDISRDIRTEQCAERASQLAALPEVRQALLQKQRDFLKPPGLVAEGRDMGTVVFPQAQTKIFLTASAQVRIKRRHKQLQELGKSASISEIEEEMLQRDARDMSRCTSPLVPAQDAFVIDNTYSDIDESCKLVIDRVEQSLLANTKLGAES